MTNLKFLCVILLCSCAVGLDLNASKYVGRQNFHLHHCNNKNELKQVPSLHFFDHHITSDINMKITIPRMIHKLKNCWSSCRCQLAQQSCRVRDKENFSMLLEVAHLLNFEKNKKIPFSLFFLLMIRKCELNSIKLDLF